MYMYLFVTTHRVVTLSGKWLLWLQEIDAHLERVTDQGYSAIVGLGQKAFKHATNVVVTTAIKV